MTDSLTKEKKVHSPGPWAVAEDDRPGMSYNRQVVQADAPYLTVCFMTSDGPNKENARVIAAAPDMLELLREIEDWLRPECVKEPDRTFFWKVVDVVRKAEGRK